MDMLGLNFPFQVQLRNKYQMGVITSNDYFHTMLYQWVSHNGKDATLQNLINIFRSANLDNIVGEFILENNCSREQLCNPIF